jgi:hypothetical protein
MQPSDSCTMLDPRSHHNRHTSARRVSLPASSPRNLKHGPGLDQRSGEGLAGATLFGAVVTVAVSPVATVPIQAQDGRVVVELITGCWDPWGPAGARDTPRGLIRRSAAVSRTGG